MSITGNNGSPGPSLAAAPDDSEHSCLVAKLLGEAFSEFSRSRSGTAPSAGVGTTPPSLEKGLAVADEDQTPSVPSAAAAQSHTPSVLPPVHPNASSAAPESPKSGETE
jgi:hypothetical protein